MDLTHAIGCKHPRLRLSLIIDVAEEAGITEEGE
jgi:hypothetical protein